MLEELKKKLESYELEYKKKVDGLYYWSSSLFFSAGLGFCALCDYYDCDIIIDSGTGKFGLSTEIFAKCFPNKKIITIDTHSYYHNEKIIKDRLKIYNNIEFIKGNSADVIPLLLGKLEDKKICIMYDGPKGKQAYDLFQIHRKNKNVVFASFDDCGNHNEYTKKSYEVMLNTHEVLFWSDEKWFNDKYGYLDKNRYFVNENSDINSPKYYKEHPYSDKYPRGTGTCFIINK